MEIGERIKARRLELDMSQDELAAKLGYKSRSSINKIELGLQQLRQHKIVGIAKALQTTPEYIMGWDEPEELPLGAYPLTSQHKIPILGRIAAGLPIYADEQVEGYTVTDLNGGAEYFGLRVQGDSMNAARIQDGDILIVRRQDTAENGQIAVVMVGTDEATVKRWYQAGDIVTLMPQSLNPQHRPQIYDTKRTAVRVIGLVVKIEITL